MKSLIKKLLKKIENRDVVKKILINSSWLISGKFFHMVIAVIVGAWVARHLGPNQFGVLNYVIAYYGMFQWIGDVGIEKVCVKELLTHQDQTPKILGTCLFLRILFSIVGILVIYISFYFSKNLNSENQKIVMILAFQLIFQSLSVIGFWYQAHSKSKYNVYARIFGVTLSSAFRVALIITNKPIIYFAYAMLIETILISFGHLFIYLFQKHKISDWKIDFKMMRDILNYSWFVWISIAGLFIYQSIDNFMLEKLSTAHEIGIFSAGIKISQFLEFFAIAVVASSFPSLLEAKRIDNNLYFTRLKKLFRSLSGLAYSFIVPIYVLSPFLIHILYGEAYDNSSQILRVHIWSNLFIFFICIQDTWNVSEKLTSLSLYRVLIAIVFKVILNQYFIPIYGGLGACYSQIISLSASLFISNLIFKKSRLMIGLQLRSLVLMK